MLEIIHICVTSHFFWLKRENLEWPSLLRVRRAPPVTVIRPGAAGSFLRRRRGAALSRSQPLLSPVTRLRQAAVGQSPSCPPMTCLFTR